MSHCLFFLDPQSTGSTSSIDHSETEQLFSSRQNDMTMKTTSKKSVTFNREVFIRLIPSRNDSKIFFIDSPRNDSEYGKHENNKSAIKKTVRFRDTVQVYIISRQDIHAIQFPNL